MKKTKLTIDRLEGDIAVCLSGSNKLDISRKVLPENAKEGDIFYLTVTNSEEETENQEKLAKGLLNEVLKEE